MDAAREYGLRLPDDLSILGFDDIPQASFVYPKLTTVRQPLEQMGQVAVRMLLEQIEGQSQRRQRVALATQLVIRDSCGPYPPHRENAEKNGRQPIANNQP
jgi:LacI family transcriptional regulator